MSAWLLVGPVDARSVAETVDLASATMRNRQRTRHVPLYLYFAKFEKVRLDRVLAVDLVNSDIVGIDSISRAAVWPRSPVAFIRRRDPMWPSGAIPCSHASA